MFEVIGIGLTIHLTIGLLVAVGFGCYLIYTGALSAADWSEDIKLGIAVAGTSGLLLLWPIAVVIAIYAIWYEWSNG